MTTPVHPTAITGSIGEALASVFFIGIGWAPPVKLSQDIGTDLLTFARDTAALEEKAVTYDLGAPVLMQVKGSDTDYLEPTDNRDGTPGWWFAESKTYHFDHWLSFGLPYLLVLVDVRNKAAYWAEVNGNAIVPTGKGRKIFIPAAQKVDADSVEQLARIAVSRRRYAVEGAVWRGSLNDLGPADRLRNALVIPRMIAPHPNRRPENLTFEEAAAMVMRNRTHQFARRGGAGDSPPLEEMAEHRSWGWRFVYALQQLVTSNDVSLFTELESNARHRFERDASLVVQACAMYATGDADSALRLLVPSRYTKPADLGWLHLHRAALLLELDRTDEAAEAARRALFALKSLDGDLSVSVMRGGAASVLYSTADFASGDLEATVIAQDNAGTWWRAQDVSWALEKDLQYRFDGWTDSNTTRFINATPSTYLSTARWNAAFGGTWGAWRNLGTINAELALTTSRDPGEVRDALSTLIFVGEKTAAKSAAAKIWKDGPIAPLQTIVSDLADRVWSKRDEGATLAVLTAAGDLLAPEAADKVVNRVLELLESDGEIRVHGRSSSFRWFEIDGALRTVLKAASAASHRSCADLIASLFGECPDSTASSLMRVATGLTIAHLESLHLGKLVEVAKRRGDYYGNQLLEVAAVASPDAVAELRVQAESGNLHAFRSLLVAGSRERDDFIEFGRSAALKVREMVAGARGKDGVSTIAGHTDDHLDDLTLAALNTDDLGLWNEITDALEASVLEQTQQQSAIRRLAHQFPKLPQNVQAKLRDLAPHLKGINAGVIVGSQANHFQSAVLHLRIAAGLIPDIEVEARLLAQLRDDPVGFVETLGAWNSNDKLPFISTMIVDADPKVRAQAGYSLVEHGQAFPADGDRALAVLQAALMQDDGCALRDAVAQALASYRTHSFMDIEKQLRVHPSAKIRSRFVEAV